jgi:hypothetical protein
MMTESVYVGNAGVDSASNRGWLLGHFMTNRDIRRSDELEIKWAIHPVGDERREWVSGERRTTVLVLISGCFHVRFPERTVVLAEQGDYVVWGQGIDHSWYAEEDSVVLAVRWPSVPGYAVPTS